MKGAAVMAKTLWWKGKAARAVAGICLLVLTLSAWAAGCGKKDDKKSPQVLQDGQAQKTDSETGSEGKETDMGNQDVENGEGENQGMAEFENHFEQASAALRADYEALTVLGADAVRGNLYLAAKGENGSAITWESSDPAVISDREQPQEGYDAVPAGVVVRQAQDVKVALYAWLTLDGVTLRKDFEVTVLAKPEEAEYTEYLFSYFVGNGINQENIFFATSEDGFTWKDTNKGQPVLTTELGTTGIRDPFLLRSVEGDRFFIIATDLCIAKDGDWGKAQRAGSQSIFIWESLDLVNWSKPRLVKVNSDAAGCTWAPEAFYDELTGEYLVFWASRVATDNYAKQRIYYVKTRDFYNFTEPEVWIDYPFSVIDTTVVRDGSTYYRFTKYEDKSRIIMERADRLLGEWAEVESESLSAQEGVEGPGCFALHEKDQVDGNRFCLLLDHFVGSGYYMMITKDLETAEFERKRGYSLPQKRPRHGTVIPVTRQEYERIVEKYNQ
ncbi:MAG: glycoside hydrolase family 43 protein [Lachnospiraceae bacterium]|nr:glycoside hydrolase family 43 protein [Lachnospiraceae bacterium]